MLTNICILFDSAVSVFLRLSVMIPHMVEIPLVVSNQKVLQYVKLEKNLAAMELGNSGNFCSYFQDTDE